MALEVGTTRVSLRDIFSRGLRFDEDKVLLLDVANVDDELDAIE